MRILVLITMLWLSSIEIFSQVNSNLYLRGLNQGSSFVYDDTVKANVGDSLNERTIKVFRNADINGDSKISINELQKFQNWLQRNFKYKSNSTALHPNDFMEQGGGDCEDFAIMTTCMLNYYGIVAFVAGFGRVTVNKHAICIVKVKNDNASGFLYYTLRGWGIPEGIYIPVDYDVVGGLSAIDRRWKIARVNAPISIYGAYM